MSDVSKYQRSKQLIQEVINQLIPQLSFASDLNDSLRVQQLSSKLEQLRNTIKCLDDHLNDQKTHFNLKGGGNKSRSMFSIKSRWFYP